MMQNLMLEEGGVLSVKNVSLPKATFVKFKPQSSDFLDISNPRAVLEKQLRAFSCVTVGDQICLPYNNKRFYLEVQDVKPKDAACIIECDCNVDFDAPVGYTEPDYTQTQPGHKNEDLPAPQKALSEDREDEARRLTSGAFKPFAGGGQRLDGRELKSTQAAFLEAMPKPPSTEQANIWCSSGMSCSDTRTDNVKVASTRPSRPSFRKPNTKWAKASKVAFSGTGQSLK
mmetsp:Transcript_15930/g.49288  ORF Transcript_15930/g.49288 Transcript_15930/m.49288 type:complete len:229 (-) Transcript_15930:366-1052(-)